MGHFNITYLREDGGGILSEMTSSNIYENVKTFKEAIMKDVNWNWLDTIFIMHPARPKAVHRRRPKAVNGRGRAGGIVFF